MRFRPYIDQHQSQSERWIPFGRYQKYSRRCRIWPVCGLLPVEGTQFFVIQITKDGLPIKSMILIMLFMLSRTYFHQNLKIMKTCMKDMIPDLLLLLQQLIYVLMTMLRQMSPNRLNQHREKGRCLASMPMAGVCCIKSSWSNQWHSSFVLKHASTSFCC